MQQLTWKTESDRNRNLEVSEHGEIAEWKNMYGRADGEQQLEFMD